MGSSNSYRPINCWADRERFVDERGYIRVYVPEHPRSFCNGWYYEHRLVAERRAKRLLDREETVHHINHVKSDNRLINLFVCLRSEHDKAHSLTG